MIGQIKRWLGLPAPLDSKWQQHSLQTLPLLAIDLELTSLQKKHSHITSVGWICGAYYRIALSDAHYAVIQSNADLQQSPVIHGLTASDISNGHSLADTLQILLPLMRDKLCLFHHAQLDINALQLACQQHHMDMPDLCYVDTLLLAQYLLHKANQPIASDALSLKACRERHNLPSAPEHNALDDAMATLELYMAQTASLGLAANTPLKALLHTGAIRSVPGKAA